MFHPLFSPAFLRSIAQRLQLKGMPIFGLRLVLQRVPAVRIPGGLTPP